MKKSATTVFSFYWRRLRTYKRSLFALGALLPLAVLFGSIVPPIILANVLNRLASGHYLRHHLWASFGWQLVLYAVLELLGSMAIWRLIDIVIWHLEGNMDRDLARDVFGHLINESADFHANHFGGSLVSQSNKLIGSYVRIADTTVFVVIPLILAVVFSVAVLLPKSALFAIVLLLFAIVYTVSAFFVTRKTRRLGAEHASKESHQTGLLADAITNVMAIKSFARRSFENKRFGVAVDDTYDGLMAMARAHQWQQGFFSGMIGVISALSLTVAVISVLDFRANVATVFLILSYTGMIGSNLFQFSNNAIRSYNRALGDASNMIEILDQVPEVQDPVKPERSRIARGDILFDRVTFRHGGADEPLFDDLQLHIKPGEKIGLVGHSGSGKTTLTRILLRFSDIQGGAIKIDGQNIAAITQDDLHQHIAYVPQEPLLFHRSIAENIGYGDPQATQQAVEGVAKLAHAHEFVKDLPEGYDTLVGERGVKLSGGQRQRIAIARAMLKNAPVLVLDEATSALDSESEILIQEALWKLMEGRTAIAIAHRLSTIQKMDRIIVLDNGRILEQGSHQELLALGGTYAKLWAHQSGGFLSED